MVNGTFFKIKACGTIAEFYFEACYVQKINQ